MYVCKCDGCMAYKKTLDMYIVAQIPYHHVVLICVCLRPLQGPRMAELAGQEVPIQKVPKKEGALLCLGGDQYASSWYANNRSYT